MTTNGSGKETNGNLATLLVVGILVLLSIALIFGFVLALIVWGEVDAALLLPWALPLLGIGITFLFSQIKANQQARVLKATRDHITKLDAKVDTVVDTATTTADTVKKVSAVVDTTAAATAGLQVQVDGVMHELNKAQVGEAAANATLDQIAVGKKEAEKLAEVNEAKLAEAVAAPAMVPASKGAVQDVNVVNPIVPVKEVGKKK